MVWLDYVRCVIAYCQVIVRVQVWDGVSITSRSSSVSVRISLRTYLTAMVKSWVYFVLVLMFVAVERRGGMRGGGCKYDKKCSGGGKCMSRSVLGRVLTYVLEGGWVGEGYELVVPTCHGTRDYPHFIYLKGGSAARDGCIGRANVPLDTVVLDTHRRTVDHESRQGNGLGFEGLRHGVPRKHGSGLDDSVGRAGHDHGKCTRVRGQHTTGIDDRKGKDFGKYATAGGTEKHTDECRTHQDILENTGSYFLIVTGIISQGALLILQLHCRTFRCRR